MHLPVDLVSQPIVDREVQSRFPVVLRVDVEPCAAPVFIRAADSCLRGARIAEQKIRECVARPLAIERECAARGVRIDGIEFEPEQISAGLESMTPAIEEHVVIQLVAAILSRDEGHGIADRAELTRE